MKMQGVYKQNPALGDSESLSKEMDENAGKLDRLKTELNKFEVRGGEWGEGGGGGGGGG